MKILSRLVLVAVVSVLFQTMANAQATGTGSSRYTAFFFTVDPAPDPALRHNKLLKEQSGDGVMRQIGNYKVKGNPYLFGGRNKGDMFSKEAKAYNIYLNYNTYNQELGFYSTSNPTEELIKEPGTVDSFIIQENIELEIHAPVKFVYGELIGSKEKGYYQEIYAGPKYSVYKKYKSELGFVSSNYMQSDLRTFDLNVEYVYVDADKKMKKIKPNAYTVIKEFKNVKDLSGLVNDDIFTANTEQAFRKTFEYLNN
jgi:hypothetical protein